MIGKFLCSCIYSLCNYLYFVSTEFQCQITFYSKQMNFLLCICSCMYVWFRWMFFRPDLGWMFGDKWWNSDIFVYSLLISFFFIFTDGFKNYFCQHWGEHKVVTLVTHRHRRTNSSSHRSGPLRDFRFRIYSQLPSAPSHKGINTWKYSLVLYNHCKRALTMIVKYQRILTHT
jgi:hypothetical protein